MIEIIQIELNTDGAYWSCWLQISQQTEAWMLPTTAPGTIAREDLQAYFEAQETELWRVAQKKRYSADVWEHIPYKRLLRATALVILDEINALRSRAGLTPRMPDQIVAAIKAKLSQ